MAKDSHTNDEIAFLYTSNKHTKKLQLTLDNTGIGAPTPTLLKIQSLKRSLCVHQGLVPGPLMDTKTRGRLSPLDKMAAASACSRPPASSDPQPQIQNSAGDFRKKSTKKWSHGVHPRVLQGSPATPCNGTNQRRSTEWI